MTSRIPKSTLKKAKTEPRRNRKPPCCAARVSIFTSRTTSAAGRSMRHEERQAGFPFALGTRIGSGWWSLQIPSCAWVSKWTTLPAIWTSWCTTKPVGSSGAGTVKNTRPRGEVSNEYGILWPLFRTRQRGVSCPRGGSRRRGECLQSARGPFSLRRWCELHRSRL